jgi:hypothetical protein
MWRSQEKRKEAISIFTFLLLDDTISLHNSTSRDCLDRSYAIELKIYTTDTSTRRSVSYLEVITSKVLQPSWLGYICVANDNRYVPHS